MKFTRRVLLLMLFALLPLFPATAPAQTAAPKITSLGQEALSVKAKSGEDTTTTYISVLNAGPVSTPIHVAFQASNSERVSVLTSAPHDVRADGATRVAVTLRGLATLRDNPTEGQLVVTGGQEPVARAVVITPAPQPAADWRAVIWITAGSLGVILVLAVGAWALKKHQFKNLGGRAPGPKWTWDSWASTLTAAGAIFGTVLAKATLPAAPREIANDTLSQLSLTFGIMIAIGPFIFQSLRRLRNEPHDELWGYSPVLLLAYAITLVAVVGELATLTLLAWELTGGFWGGWVVAGGAILILLALWYFFVTAYEQVTTDWEGEAKEAATEAARLRTEGQKVNLVKAFGHTTWPGEGAAAGPPLAANGAAPSARPAPRHARMP